MSWSFLISEGADLRDINADLAEVHRAEVSKQTITAIADRVMEGMAGWRSRPWSDVRGDRHRRDNVKIREASEASYD